VRCEVTGEFNVRGGIGITVEAEYERERDSATVCG
jgi:NADPH-dependent 7-cyano-7-deazaguanine reductase QueF